MIGPDYIIWLWIWENVIYLEMIETICCVLMEKEQEKSTQFLFMSGCKYHDSVTSAMRDVVVSQSDYVFHTNAISAELCASLYKSMQKKRLTYLK